MIELKKDLNQLDVVTITSVKEEAFDIKNYNKQLNADIKNNSGAYSPAPSGNMDFIKIAGLLVNLFKKKNGKKKNPTEVTHEQLKELFESDELINDQLLTERFNIPKKYHGLFLDYCVKNGISTKLLDLNFRFQLLDVLVKYNEGFQKVLEHNQTSPEQ